MRYFIASVILLALVSISVFGFVGFSQMHSAMGSDCSTNSTQGTPCPVNDGIFAFAAFHLKELQKLGQSGFLSVSPMFVISFVLLALFLFLVFSGAGTERLLSRTYFRKNYEDKLSDVGPKVISWLAGLERSPAFIAGA